MLLTFKSMSQVIYDVRTPGYQLINSPTDVCMFESPKIYRYRVRVQRDYKKALYVGSENSGGIKSE